ncbi:hypothetical protein EZV73_22080 [Acidaminobacter sp. JC074]|uniref:PD-(D/E)XK nuclease family protein n=1 Tax=Acidaminobacter sp. JC074 TaxID=2530199 RepID=UPI001F10302F|nr:PD-(D/E)XK nuclease family protein [Acidaminobacter sp. JC074]MCH4890287.1 hypothetical protein [Acidaminobacter sp. JC074]
MDYNEIEVKLQSLIVDYICLPPKQDQIITIPRIFNKVYNENFISDYLAYIFNPKINGIGTKPLQVLVDYFMPTYEINNTKIEVMREYVFNSGRRIDLLIILDELIVALEHKVWSDESENQTISYSSSLDKLYPEKDILKIFLSPSGKVAQSEKFIAMSYETLVSLLKSVDTDDMETMRQRVLFEELILHIEEYFMTKGFNEVTEQTRLYLKNKDLIEELQSAFITDAVNTFIIFEERIRNYFEPYKFEVNFSPKRGYQQLYKNHWNDESLFIHHEFSLSCTDLLQNEVFNYYLHVEGSERHQFLEFFDKNYSMNIDNLNEMFQYEGNLRGVTLCSKKIENPYYFDSKDQDAFEDDLNVINKLTRLLDAALEEYKNI